MKMKILDDGQLKRIREHKYSAQGNTLFDPAFQVFWRWLVERFPLWVAPNLITVVGLLINAVTSFLLIYYCPNATEVAPGWVYAANSIGLFVYQSLDAIDGKQARRTGSSTPLGELFDHGCDSISTVLVGIAFSVTMQMGNQPWWMAFICISSFFTFYFGHWASYVTGVLQFGLIDVTELQVSTYAGFMVTAIFGPEFWDVPVPVLGVTYKMAVAAVISCGCLVSFVRFTKVILGGGAGVNGSTVANTSVLSPGINMLVFVLFPVLCVATQSKTQILVNNPVLFLFFVGIVCAKLTNRIIIAHMTRSELGLWDVSLVPVLVLFLNQYFGTLLNEYVLLLFSVAFVCFDITRYLSIVYSQIADSLGVWIFSLEQRRRSDIGDSIGDTTKLS